MRKVGVDWAGGKLAQDIAIGKHHFRADEAIEKNGEDTGPLRTSCCWPRWDRAPR
jgi:hypothetical protein